MGVGGILCNMQVKCSNCIKLPNLEETNQINTAQNEISERKVVGFDQIKRTLGK